MDSWTWIGDEILRDFLNSANVEDRDTIISENGCITLLREMLPHCKGKNITMMLGIADILQTASIQDIEEKMKNLLRDVMKSINKLRIITPTPIPFRKNSLITLSHRLTKFLMSLEGSYEGRIRCVDISNIFIFSQRRFRFDQFTRFPEKESIYCSQYVFWSAEAKEDVKKLLSSMQLATIPSVEELPVTFGKNISQRVLSYGPSGVSSFSYQQNFLPRELLQFSFKEISDALPWEHKEGKLRNNTRYSMPRLMAWYGPCDYKFSGTVLHANAVWPEVLQKILRLVESATGIKYNSVLANLYRNGDDSVSWHSDDENLFGKGATISSVSLGTVRKFELRKKPYPNIGGKDIRERQPQVSLSLSSGSLIVMKGSTQEDWEHRIPKDFSTGERINLTFRSVVEKPKILFRPGKRRTAN